MALKTAENQAGCWALIVSRQGSTRLPGKATKMLGKKPLIAYTFEACLQAPSISRRMIFSDDPKVLQLAQASGIEIPGFERPAAISQSDTSTEETLRYFLKQFPASTLPSTMMLLQPTSPFRTWEDIENALALFNNTPCDGVISVTMPEKPAHWLYQKNDIGFLEPLLPQTTEAWLPNGAIYLFKPQQILDGADFTSGNILPYVMPRERSIDIDTAEDFRWTENRL